MFLIAKALHIVSVVSWFAGLLYIVRLFVYLREAQERSAEERAILEPQLQLMARRLWFGITWPAAIATLVFGLILLPPFMPLAPWLHAKLGLVVVLVAYHVACHVMHARLQRGEAVWGARGFRIWNEIATLLLVMIVFVVVLKTMDALLWAFGVVALLVAVVLVVLAVRRRLSA